tara:strand:- start:2852 stop:3226 length:375 start_codon:yes stop_codon:yes gene_type:complete
MKKLLLAFALLYSSATYAGVGDVYYCVTDNQTWVNESGNEKYTEEKFKFQWTETEIIYSGGSLNNVRQELTQSFPSQEKFYANSTYEGIATSTVRYAGGKLVFVVIRPQKYGGALVLLATCEKF